MVGFAMAFAFVAGMFATMALQRMFYRASRRYAAWARGNWWRGSRRRK